MSELVVVDHHYDTGRDMYVLVLGVEEVREVPLLDEEGNHMRGPDITAPGEETVLGEPLYEQQTFLMPVEDIAFSGSDPKWEGMAPEDIAKEQRKVARAALRKREKDAEDAKARLKALPGVGDAL